MSLNERKTRTSADVTGPDLSSAVPSASLSLEEKEKSKTDATEDNDAINMPKLQYPQGWKLWLVYIATLLTMFLVGFDSILISMSLDLMFGYVRIRCRWIWYVTSQIIGSNAT